MQIHILRLRRRPSLYDADDVHCDDTSLGRTVQKILRELREMRIRLSRYMYRTVSALNTDLLEYTLGMTALHSTRASHRNFQKLFI